MKNWIVVIIAIIAIILNVSTCAVLYKYSPININMVIPRDSVKPQLGD